MRNESLYLIFASCVTILSQTPGETTSPGNLSPPWSAPLRVSNPRRSSRYDSQSQSSPSLSRLWCFEGIAERSLPCIFINKLQKCVWREAVLQWGILFYSPEGNNKQKKTMRNRDRWLLWQMTRGPGLKTQQSCQISNVDSSRGTGKRIYINGHYVKAVVYTSVPSNPGQCGGWYSHSRACFFLPHLLDYERKKMYL